MFDARYYRKEKLLVALFGFEYTLSLQEIKQSLLRDHIKFVCLDIDFACDVLIVRISSKQSITKVCRHFAGFHIELLE